MLQAYSDFFKNVTDWKILEKRTIHDYNEDETPIDVICVEVGVLRGIGPIIRWMTLKEYEYFRACDGTTI